LRSGRVRTPIDPASNRAQKRQRLQFNGTDVVTPAQWPKRAV
jgi:hypothetical protein